MVAVKWVEKVVLTCARGSHVHRLTFCRIRMHLCITPETLITISAALISLVTLYAFIHECIAELDFFQQSIAITTTEYKGTSTLAKIQSSMATYLYSNNLSPIGLFPQF